MEKEKVKAFVKNKKTVIITVAILLAAALAITLILVFVGGRKTEGEDTDVTTSATKRESSESRGKETQFTTIANNETLFYTTHETGYIYQAYTDIGGGKYTESNKPYTSERVLMLVNKDNPLPDDFGVFLSAVTDSIYVATQCNEALFRMISDCEAAGGSPQITRGFLSGEDLERAYLATVEEYVGYGMNREDARRMASMYIGEPGFSEYETGFAVDITDRYDGVKDAAQDRNPTIKWLMENCTKYGFIIRFPYSKQNTTGVNYSPWRFRYVGRAAAEEIKNNGFCLEEYITYLTNQGRTEAPVETTTPAATTTAPPHTTVLETARNRFGF